MNTESSPTRPVVTAGTAEQYEAIGEFLRECEGVLGVEGPCGLARRTRRSKAWWSKVRSLGVRFPDWEYLNTRVLPPDLPEDARQHLRQCHVKAWHRIHDPEERPAPATGVVATEDQLRALEAIASRALEAGQCVEALRALQLLEVVLQVPSPTWTWQTQQRLLARCYRQQSECQRRLGQPGAAAALARCGVEYGQLAGSTEEVEAAREELARAEASLAR